ncbi:uncharacterized protein LOC122051155 [Zingiber officinale]|uniref:uncharacterized protein LOC122051155 n=1 Tax=Zingiber officinale TaxID=94328 RepID=UPI001C4CC113|nr:uncharacterized protein LOC122051155 [Zingiber officinale]
MARILFPVGIEWLHPTKQITSTARSRYRYSCCSASRSPIPGLREPTTPCPFPPSAQRNLPFLSCKGCSFLRSCCPSLCKSRFEGVMDGDFRSSSTVADPLLSLPGDSWRGAPTQSPHREDFRCGGLVVTKAASLKNILRALKEKRGKICLEYLRSLSVDEIKAELSKFKGIGPKTGKKNTTRNNLQP